MIMKKIIKPHKTRKPSASTGVPSFARGKDQILKSPARLQRHKKNELGEFDDGKNLEFREVPQWQYIDDGSGNLSIVDTNTGQTGTFSLPELTVSTPRPIYAPKPWQYSSAFNEDAFGIKKIIHNIGAIVRVPMRMFSAANPNSEIIDLNDNVVRVDPSTKNLSTILTNDFVENNSNNIRFAKDFVNTNDTLIGDSQIPLSRISQFYGVEDGKLKIGTPSDFNPYTTIVPVRNKNVGRIYGIEEIKGNPNYEKYDREYNTLKTQFDNYRRDYFGVLPAEEYKKQFDEVNIPVIGGILNAIYPTKARKLYENQKKARERYNNALTSGNVDTSLKLLDMKKKLYDLSDSIAKYSPGVKVITDKGTLSLDKTDFSNVTNSKTLFVSPTGDGSFFIHNLNRAAKNPKIRKELNKRFKSNSLYPVKVDNGRYAHYSTTFPSYEDYTSADFLRDPKTMFVIGTTKQPESQYNKGKDDSLIQNTAEYNQWRSTLPKNLQTETPDYDLYGAFQAGLQPQYNEEDDSYHLGSRDPKTGKILKKITHPTFSKAIYSDMELGYYPIYKDGEIYTEQPLKYKHGKDSGIHIKKANRGKFTAAAKRAGMGVQEYARKILSAPKGKYSSTLRKRANFARNASKFNH